MISNVPICDMAVNDVLRHAVDGMFVIDRERRVVLFSDACERITGADRSSVIGSACPCHQLMECRDEHGRSLSGVLCPGLKIFQGEIPSYRQRMSIRHQDGHRVWVETTYSPMKAENGETIGVVAIMRDITEVKERENELREAAERSFAGPLDKAAAVCDVPEGASPYRKYLSEAASKMGPLDRKLTSIERKEILAALKRTRGQRTLAAQKLGISRSRLYRRMEALRIKPRKIGPRKKP